MTIGLRKKFSRRELGDCLPPEALSMPVEDDR